MAPLGLLTEGEKGEIVDIKARFSNMACDCSCSGKHKRHETMCHAQDMGLRQGKVVEVLSNQGIKGAMLLKVDESRIAIDRGMAMKIFVRSLD